MSEFKSRLKERASIVESWLATCLEEKTIPAGLKAAMEYSLLAGGKRIRPVLCLSSAQLFGGETTHILPFAAAFEFIHTYSLIHDDLPAMDNDDLRRGRPSSHKQFDEATAILAGDSLLTDAFNLMASVSCPAHRVLAAIQCASYAAGSSGMAGGQFLDMQYTSRTDVPFEEVATMQAMKTGALLRSPCECGAILAGAEEKDVNNLRCFGTTLGMAFQIADDILDETGTESELGKPVGSDVEQGKVTYSSLFGIEKSRQMARKHATEAIDALSEYTSDEAEFLRQLALYVVERVC